jgi:hypothetical protein
VPSKSQSSRSEQARDGVMQWQWQWQWRAGHHITVACAWMLTGLPLCQVQVTLYCTSKARYESNSGSTVHRSLQSYCHKLPPVPSVSVLCRQCHSLTVPPPTLPHTHTQTHTDAPLLPSVSQFSSSFLVLPALCLLSLKNSRRTGLD